jgi:hypothetical protein
MTNRIIASRDATSIPTNVESLTSARQPHWHLDAEDLLNARLAQLHGLASCVTVLGRAAMSAAGDELTDDALPQLGYVMQDLAKEAIQAKDQLDFERRAVLQGGAQ